jgi:trehalose-phosphatase
MPSDADVQARLTGTPLVVMLDVDGTLAPIAPRPEDAAVPPRTREAVASVAALPDAHVALVSGRAAADALRMVDVPGLWAIGNHGAEVIAPDGGLRVDAHVAPYEHAVADAVRALSAELGAVPGVLVEDKRWSLSVHYRLAGEADVPAVRAAVEAAAARTGLRVGLGKQVIELRAPVQVHKGTAVLALARELGAELPSASVLFAGDDVTDEDAFVKLRAEAPHAVTVRVSDAAGATETAAEFVVPDPDAVRALLESVAAARIGAQRIADARTVRVA